MTISCLATEYWHKACTKLALVDPVMGQLVSSHGDKVMLGKSDAFITLCRAVTGQQISVKAADKIWLKLETHFTKLTPKRIQLCDLTILRNCGLSQSKAQCYKQLADFFIQYKAHTDSYWRSQPLEQSRKQLLTIKGIGPWTFEMFAIFYLQHPDILPLGDMGLIAAINKHYKHLVKASKGSTVEASKLTTKQISLITEKWKPWRTVATWYLWRSIDPEPVIY